MVPQGTTGGGRLRSEISLDARECVPSLILQIHLGDSKALRELQSLLYFVGTLLYESGWRKRTETQDKAGHLWVPADCELSSIHQA